LPVLLDLPALPDFSPPPMLTAWSNDERRDVAGHQGLWLLLSFCPAI
jgi:hypothetical protein